LRFALPLLLLATDAQPPQVTLAPAPASAAGPARPNQIGTHRPFTAAQLAKGKWSKKPRVWRLAIKSEGAAALRVHFKDFHAGAGKVWVHNGKDRYGPYSGDGLYGDGEFWSHVVPGDRLIIEYEGPGRAAPPFQVPELSHLTVNPLE